MYRSITFAAALLIATASYAQTNNSLQIGYVKGAARGDAIYLINPDGTGERKLYQAPRDGRFGGQIDRLSIRPGGGEVAFVLNNTQLMIQRHDASGQPVGAAFEIDFAGSCGLYDPDYRSDADLYVADTCSNVWLVDTDAGTKSIVFSGANISALAAVGTSLLYVDAGSGVDTGSLKLRTAGGTTTTIGEINYTLPLHLDAVGNVGVLSGSTSYRTINLTTAGENAGCTTGGMVKYSPDGIQMVYEFRNMLMVHNSDCSGTPSRIARGADAVAWRSD